MRTVKLKGRTVIKKSKENYKDPSEGGASVVWVFTAPAMNRGWGAGFVSWETCSCVGALAVMFLESGRQDDWPFPRPMWVVRRPLLTLFFLGSDSTGLVAGVHPYLCSSGSWRAVLRTPERAAALFGNPVSYSFSLGASSHCRERAVRKMPPLSSCLFQCHAHFRIIWKWETFHSSKWRSMKWKTTDFRMQTSTPSCDLCDLGHSM